MNAVDKWRHNKTNLNIHSYFGMKVANKCLIQNYWSSTDNNCSSTLEVYLNIWMRMKAITLEGFEYKEISSYHLLGEILRKQAATLFCTWSVTHSKQEGSRYWGKLYKVLLEAFKFVYWRRNKSNEMDQMSCIQKVYRNLRYKRRILLVLSRGFDTRNRRVVFDSVS